MKIVTVLIAVAFVASTIPAQAWGSRSSSDRSDRRERSDTRDFDGFRTGRCKTSSCEAKHPGGTYVYPNH
jgi:hypothetical protein